jgi:hypothetical protein
MYLEKAGGKDRTAKNSLKKESSRETVQGALYQRKAAYNEHSYQETIVQGEGGEEIIVHGTVIPEKNVMTGLCRTH